MEFLYFKLNEVSKHVVYPVFLEGLRNLCFALESGDTSPHTIIESKSQVLFGWESHFRPFSFNNGELRGCVR